MASTGMILAGIFAAETIDSSGERLMVDGLDISSFQDGTAPVNYEHKDAKDSNGEEKVGVVLDAKKIFSARDCTSALERRAWESVRQPLVFGHVRLFDGAGHSGAMALAASIRDQVANDEKVLVRWSIEGSTLAREGNVLKESMAIALAATWTPCNKVCDTILLEDPQAPAGFDKAPSEKKTSSLLESALKSELPEESRAKRLGGALSWVYNPIVEDPIAKTLTAGSYDAAPSALTGGAALQRESFDGSKKKKDHGKALDALRRYMEQRKVFDKAEFRTLLRHELPEASDEYLKHFEDIVDDVCVSRSQVKKTDPIVLLDSWGIQLRKHLSDLRSAILFGDPGKPTIYSVSMKIKGDLRLAGRFILVNNELHILEDYFGLISKAVPEGPLTSSTVNMIQAMQQSPELEIKETPYVPPEPKADEVEPQPEAPIPAPAPVRAPVFAFHRAGFDHPHTVEFHDGNCLLDGKLVSPDEAATILENVQSGAATLRYKAPDVNEAIAKMEEQFGDLMKGFRQPPGVKPVAGAVQNPQNPQTSQNPHAQDLLAHIRAAEAAGHIPQGTSEGMTQHVYGDPMVPGLGNRKAWEEFRSKNKPGVYVGMDLNDLKSLNDHSHGMGDDAIRAYGRTLRETADEATPGVAKIFRVGGDEMTAHFPSNEHAMQFARKLHEKLEALPPMGGVHKVSTGMGFGTTPEQADEALKQAKTGKYHPGQEAISERDRRRVFPVGQTPNMAHSLVPGSEGAVPLRNAQTTALHATAELPKPPKAPGEAAPEPKMPKPEPPPEPTTPKPPKAP